MTTKLSLFNGALLLCGERFLASLTEEREPRRLLDRAWDDGAGVKACLEQGQWNFAMRTVQIDYDTGIEPGFGYRRAFEKPSDWVITSALCSDEFFRAPLMQYRDEAGYWYADLDTLYVRYVSNDVSYGLDLGKWPESFREYVEEYLANKVIRKITDSEEEEAKSDKRLKKKLLHAKNRAAMADPTSFPPPGSWVGARNRMAGGRDGGNRGSLIG
jgi:hypothetical protein